jgi:hypothetical protein
MISSNGFNWLLYPIFGFVFLVQIVLFVVVGIIFFRKLKQAVQLKSSKTTEWQRFELNSLILFSLAWLMNLVYTPIEVMQFLPAFINNPAYLEWHAKFEQYNRYTGLVWIFIVAVGVAFSLRAKRSAKAVCLERPSIIEWKWWAPSKRTNETA